LAHFNSSRLVGSRAILRKPTNPTTATAPAPNAEEGERERFARPVTRRRN